MPTVTANGLKTYYEDDDYTAPWRTDTEAVLIQHGIGRSTKFWRHWVPPLVGEYRVLRRDIRGFGQSEDPGPDYQWNINDLLEDLRSFLDILKLDRVHYVGESLGGIVGCAFAAKWPQRFRSLTLLGTPTTLQTRQQFLKLGTASRVEAVRSLGMDGMVKALIERGVITGGSPERTEWVIREWCKTPAHSLANIAGLTSTYDLAALLPQIKVPTLIIAPAHSPLTPLADQVALRDAIPSSKFVVSGTVGHENYITDADHCIASTLAFMRSHRQA